MKERPVNKVVAACVTADTKTRFKALAARRGLGESALLNSIIERAIEPVELNGADAVRGVHASARAERLYVRLYPEDRQLLAERASARGMASATYLSVLARSHLRQLAPLPDAERRAFDRCVAELSAIGRNLNQVARRANQDGVISGLTRQDIAVFIKACTAAVDHFKATLMANKASWACGYETSDR
jgi:hypothetical protein